MFSPVMTWQVVSAGPYLDLVHVVHDVGPRCSGAS